MTWTAYDRRLFATIARHCRGGRTMTATATETLSADLYAAGYRPGPPAWLDPDIEAIDRAACRESACPGCDRPLAFRPWHHPAAGSYRGMAFCVACGFAEEV